jgi:hypothetical protein
MNELYFPGGVSTENISGSNEILTYDSNSKIVSSGFDVDFLSDYELFYNSTSQTWNTGTDTTMILNTQVRGHSNYNVVSNEVSVGESGEYIIEADITILATSGGRKNSFSWLELNGIEIAGTRISCYERLSSYGASGTTRTIIDLTPSDAITIVTARNSGSGDLQQIVNGTRLFIKRGFE